LDAKSTNSSGALHLNFPNEKLLFQRQGCNQGFNHAGGPWLSDELKPMDGIMRERPLSVEGEYFPKTDIFQKYSNFAKSCT
jgi:hypothetical protein